MFSSCDFNHFTVINVAHFNRTLAQTVFFLCLLQVPKKRIFFIFQSPETDGKKCLKLTWRNGGIPCDVTLDRKAPKASAKITFIVSCCFNLQRNFFSGKVNWISNTFYNYFSILLFYFLFLFPFIEIFLRKKFEFNNFFFS